MFKRKDCINTVVLPEALAAIVDRFLASENQDSQKLFAEISQYFSSRFQAESDLESVLEACAQAWHFLYAHIGFANKNWAELFFDILHFCSGGHASQAQRTAAGKAALKCLDDIEGDLSRIREYKVRHSGKMSLPNKKSYAECIIKFIGGYLLMTSVDRQAQQGRAFELTREVFALFEADSGDTKFEVFKVASYLNLYRVYYQAKGYSEWEDDCLISAVKVILSISDDDAILSETAIDDILYSSLSKFFLRKAVPESQQFFESFFKSIDLETFVLYVLKRFSQKTGVLIPPMRSVAELSVLGRAHMIMMHYFSLSERNEEIKAWIIPFLKHCNAFLLRLNAVVGDSLKTYFMKIDQKAIQFLYCELLNWLGLFSECCQVYGFEPSDVRGDVAKHLMSAIIFFKDIVSDHLKKFFELFVQNKLGVDHKTVGNDFFMLSERSPLLAYLRDNHAGVISSVLRQMIIYGVSKSMAVFLEGLKDNGKLDYFLWASQEMSYANPSEHNTFSEFMAEVCDDLASQDGSSEGLANENYKLRSAGIWAFLACEGKLFFKNPQCQLFFERISSQGLQWLLVSLVKEEMWPALEGLLSSDLFPDAIAQKGIMLTDKILNFAAALSSSAASGLNLWNLFFSQMVKIIALGKVPEKNVFDQLIAQMLSVMDIPRIFQQRALILSVSNHSPAVIKSTFLRLRTLIKDDWIALPPGYCEFFAEIALRSEEKAIGTRLLRRFLMEAQLQPKQSTLQLFANHCAYIDGDWPDSVDLYATDTGKILSPNDQNDWFLRLLAGFKSLGFTVTQGDGARWRSAVLSVPEDFRLSLASAKIRALQSWNVAESEIPRSLPVDIPKFLEFFQFAFENSDNPSELLQATPLPRAVESIASEKQTIKRSFQLSCRANNVVVDDFSVKLINGRQLQIFSLHARKPDGLNLKNALRECAEHFFEQSAYLVERYRLHEQLDAINVQLSALGGRIAIESGQLLQVFNLKGNEKKVDALQMAAQKALDKLSQLKATIQLAQEDIASTHAQQDAVTESSIQEHQRGYQDFLNQFDHASEANAGLFEAKRNADAAAVAQKKIKRQKDKEQKRKAGLAAKENAARQQAAREAAAKEKQALVSQQVERKRTKIGAFQAAVEACLSEYGALKRDYLDVSDVSIMRQVDDWLKTHAQNPLGRLSGIKTFPSGWSEKKVNSELADRRKTLQSVQQPVRDCSDALAIWKTLSDAWREKYQKIAAGLRSKKNKTLQENTLLKKLETLELFQSLDQQPKAYIGQVNLLSELRVLEQSITQVEKIVQQAESIQTIQPADIKKPAQLVEDRKQPSAMQESSPIPIPGPLQQVCDDDETASSSLDSASSADSNSFSLPPDHFSPFPMQPSEDEVPLAVGFWKQGSQKRQGHAHFYVIGFPPDSSRVSHDSVQSRLSVDAPVFHASPSCTLFSNTTQQQLSANSPVFQNGQTFFSPQTGMHPGIDLPPEYYEPGQMTFF